MKERFKNAVCNLIVDLALLPVFILVLAGIASFIPGPVIEERHNYSISVSSDRTDNLLELVSSARIEDKVTKEVNWSTDDHYSLLDYIKDEASLMIDKYRASEG